MSISKEQCSVLKNVYVEGDTEGNGYITSEALRRVMNNLDIKLTSLETAIDEMIRIADAENDGKINYEEFVKVLDFSLEGVEIDIVHDKSDETETKCTNESETQPFYRKR
eukprot:755976_1